MSEADDRAFLLCHSVAAGGDVIAGSTITNCPRCDDRLWISPASLPMMAAHDLEIICLACAKKMPRDGDPVDIHPPSPEQQKELADHYEN